jgi:hypothetical protein
MPMGAYIENHGGTIGVLGLALAIAEPTVVHFFPTLPDWFYWGMALLATALLVVGATGLFVRRRKASEPAQEIATPQRIGMDIKGGTTRLRRPKIRNQDTSIRAEDVDLEADDPDIE